MAQPSLSLLLLLFSTFCIAAMSTPTNHSLSHSNSKSFIEAQCRITRYPEACIRYLSSSVSPNVQTPQQLARIALVVSLARARYTKAYVNKLAVELKEKKAKEYPAMKDCLEEISDGIDQLTLSLKEFRDIDRDGDDNFVWHSSNFQTWVSTALTGVLNCIDGFSVHAMRGKDKATVKAKVLNVAQVTSNALALFNRFASKHLARGSATKP